MCICRLSLFITACHLVRVIYKIYLVGNVTGCIFGVLLIINHSLNT
jgi:hypothetical protein